LKSGFFILKYFEFLITLINGILMAALSQISIKTPSHSCLVSISQDVQNYIVQAGIQNGLINLFVLHTTCGLTINENADPDVIHDLLYRLDKQAPWDLAADRHAEGNSAAHLKSSLLGSSLTIPVKSGRMVLGTWQGIFLGEFDGPRTRSICITTL
jgi:secondary thiamine-phosphate synthase enzyme